MRIRTSSVLAIGLLFAIAASTSARPQAAPLPEPKAPIVNPFKSVAPLAECLAQSSTLVSGHRGGIEPGYPENAIETFAHSVAQHPLVLEIDVRTSRDGVMVLMHDATIDRTSTGKGAISDLTVAEIQAAALKDKEGRVTSFQIPTFEAAIRWAKGRAVLLADVKEDASVEAIAAMIGTHEAQSNVAVIVYSLGQAQRLHRADPNITILYPVETDAELEALQNSGVPLDNVVAWTGIEHERPEQWNLMRQRGLAVAFGTLFFIDPELARTGNDARYLGLSREGIAMLATDRHHQAFEAIQRERDIYAALHRCKATPEASHPF
ncbi:MAG TPA: glycerophosphodiester phosphodiesterase family protein [Rhizomicrobium sp.]